MKTKKAKSQTGDLFSFLETINLDKPTEEIKPKPVDYDKTYTVSELNSDIKKMLEDGFTRISVTGEISDLRINTKTGNAYFTIKDEGGVITVACWKGVLQKLAFALEDGLSVVIFGDISIQPKASKYYIVTKNIRLSGVGEILKIIKETRERLEKQGYFDPSKKLPLPFFPKNIGIITSMSGAVIRDILHRLKERFPTKVLVFDSSMQGNRCIDDVVCGIKYFNEMTIAPDVIIIARGGGSLEDLMPFNSERMAMQALASKIPIISAIGHETDYTILDYVASKRAPTPTAAAEMATPVLSELKIGLMQIKKSYYNSFYMYFQRHLILLGRLKSSIQDLKTLFPNKQRNLDKFKTDLILTAQRMLDRHKIALQKYDLMPILEKIKLDNKHKKYIINEMQVNLQKASSQYLQQNRQLLENYLNILTGFVANYQGVAKIANSSGYLTSVADIQKSLKNSKILRIEMMDGAIDIEIQATKIP